MENPGGVHPLTSASEGNDCDSGLLNMSNKEPNIEDEQCTCTNVNENAKSQAQWTCNCCSPLNEGNTIDKDAGVAVDGFFLSSETFGCFSKVDVISEVDKEVTSEMSLRQGSGHSVSADAIVQKRLSKSASFPSSEVDVSHLTCSSKIRSVSSTTANAKNGSGDRHPAYKRSISLPANSKLVSAMKGGRAQNGTPLGMGVRVKWAADVYDPPATSVSHTVNSKSYHRSKSGKKKENQRHKQKGKKSRGSNIDMKLSNNNKVGVLSEALRPFEVTASCALQL